MNFFIDFEATQFTQEIISIGCVAENGKSFYSEVNCKGKVTPFITNLTGLTPEQISEAPSADFVFQKFYSWLYSVIDSTIPTFYVFGDNDDHYVKTTIQNVTNPFANSALCLILGNMVDYSKIVKKKFSLTRPIGLVKILEAYKEKPIEQKHNALEDAFFLQELFNFVKEDTSAHGPLEEKYYVKNTVCIKKVDNSLKTIDRFTNEKITAKRKGQEELVFKSIREAVEYVIENLIPISEKERVERNNIAKKIVASVNGGKKAKYCNYKWRMI